MCGKDMPHKNHYINRIIQIIAVISLLAAYIIGNQTNQNDIERKITDQLPNTSLVKIKSNPDVYTIHNDTEKKSDGWLVISEHQGWGGPMKVGIWINPKAKIEKLLVLNHRETPVFFNILENQKYFEQYAQKSIQDFFSLDDDVDGVSGATISSAAIARAAQKGSHFWGREHFGYSIESVPLNFKVGSNEFILIVLYSIIIISSVKKYRKMRYVTLAFSIAFLGFYLSVPISISAFGSLLMGYVPAVTTHLFWWLLILGAILMALIMGKNLYCSWACPFGGIQEFIHRLGGVNTKINPAVKRIASKAVYFLFWFSFLIMFLTSNPAMGTFEPFAVLFSFKGNGLQWYLVSIAIFGSFIIPRFWCRFFCPVGLALKTMAKAKKQIVKIKNITIKAAYKKGSLDEEAILQ